MDTVNAVRDLRVRGAGYGPSPPRRLPGLPAWRLTPARRRPFLSDTLLSFMAWASEQELEATRRRTVVGLDKARVKGKTLGPPRKLGSDQVETARRLRQEKVSLREIGRQFRVSASTVDRSLKEDMRN